MNWRFIGTEDSLTVMKLAMTRFGRIWLVALVAVVGVVLACRLPPLRQPESYHQFADARTMLRVPNFLNVVSNAGFLVVGLMGLLFLWKKRGTDGPGDFIMSGERLPYAVFFLGVLATCFGSGYYHWRPNDATLVWDRLPMAVAFMALLAAMIAERIDVSGGLLLLGPLVLAGLLSVWWWQRTGNLWPYGAAQYFSIVLIVLLMLLFPPRYSRGTDVIGVIVFYALAKVAEGLDGQIFSFIRFISGHTLKHLMAALATYWVLRMLVKRSRQRILVRRNAVYSERV